MESKNVKTKFLKYFSIFLIIFLALYLTYRVISLNNGNYKTQTTLLKTVEEGIDTTVFIVRDEAYLNSIDSKKTSVSLISDGERVAENEIISALFDSEEDAENYKKRLFYESELERYNSLLTQERINISDIMTYDSKTDDLFTKYIENIRNNSFDEARDNITDFCSKLTSRQSAMGVEIDLDSIISNINSKINSLKGPDPELVLSESTGYFVNGIDGYEDVLEYDDIKNVTTDMIEKAIKTDKKPDNNYAGKIINNFSWYMVCSVTTKDVQNIDEGDYVYVRFLNSASEDEKAEVVAVNRESKDKVALVLKCNNVTSKVFPLRKEKVKIITNTLEGYAVSKDAVRSQNGENGVYILRGKIINFRYIDIIYTDEDYVLVRPYDEESNLIYQLKQLKKENESDENNRRISNGEKTTDSDEIHIPDIEMSKYIRLYDEVIIKGSDLSDGKLVQ